LIDLQDFIRIQKTDQLALGTFLGDGKDPVGHVAGGTGNLLPVLQSNKRSFARIHYGHAYSWLDQTNAISSKNWTTRAVKNLNNRRRVVSAIIRGLWPQIIAPLWGWLFTPMNGHNGLLDVAAMDINGGHDESCQ
jgi:hypothetical protein